MLLFYCNSLYVCCFCFLSFFFFFKQKTAYEMRISDWSSDVCSSDLPCWHQAPAQCRPSPCARPCLHKARFPVHPAPGCQSREQEAPSASCHPSAGHRKPAQYPLPRVRPDRRNPAHAPPTSVADKGALSQIRRTSCRDGVGQSV